ncbi:hypothetical protein IV203_026120 [Nitzschia inconspicua]|uniref:Uncharacterized protein n=1 Tax=Nitzschia inconspicua TaxID=303405 RepID=A0A9K3LJC2_9STRA|nr:hypothetical protein IV203_026120 [Nitzschia inconspicua]
MQDPRRRCSTCPLDFGFTTFLLLLLLLNGNAFLLPIGESASADRSHASEAVGSRNPILLSPKTKISLMAMDALLEEEGKGKQSIQVLDKDGKEISEGAVVRITKTTKAYQVPLNARGKFNDNKEFVPALNGEESKYMIVPEGMCGVVTKVYVQANLSANYKVLVKFTPGDECNKRGFDPPVQFQMHFSGKEVASLL